MFRNIYKKSKEKNRIQRNNVREVKKKSKKDDITRNSTNRTKETLLF